jgi:dienelactone hydrolase
MADSSSDPDFAGYQELQPFTQADITHRVFWLGEGSPVLVMHELGGLSPSALRFGRRLAREGFRVYLPLLFGEPGQNKALRNYRALCVSHEFANLQAGVSAPIVNWIRALAAELSAQHNNAKVGAIGMCITGAFVIPLILEPCVMAPVAAQPGSPFSFRYRLIGIGRGPWMTQLNVADDDVEAAIERCQHDGVQMLAGRFKKDRICPKERLDRLEGQFRGQLIRTDLAGGSSLRPPHSTLTSGYEDAPEDPNEPTRVWFKQVVEFLKARL